VAKYSRASNLKKGLSLYERHGVPENLPKPGFGLTFKQFRGYKAPEPAPFYWKSYVSFPAALRAWAADTPPKEDLSGAEDGFSSLTSIRKEVAKEIIAALGPSKDDFRKAHCVLTDWAEYAAAGISYLLNGVRAAVARDVQLRYWVAQELMDCVEPLLLAYENPARFFEEVAPRRFESDFPKDFGPSDLETALMRWGFGAFWNSAVRGAFIAAGTKSPTRQLLLLGLLEARRGPDGRKPGSKDKRPRKRRVDAAETEDRVYGAVREYERKHGERPGLVGASVKMEAKRIGKTRAAVKKRIQRNRPK